MSGATFAEEYALWWARCSTVSQSARVVSRRGFPWKATSPCSLIDGSDGRLLTPVIAEGRKVHDGLGVRDDDRSIGCAAQGDDAGDAEHVVPYSHRDRHK